jgi:hypothetical protein
MPRNVAISLALAGVAAALLGYIVFFERGTLSSGELEKRKESALPEFVRARVARIEIQRKGKITVLERDAESTDEAGLWRVTAPYQAAADSEAVDTLLGELEYLDARRRIANVSAADRKSFGLDAPRTRLWFTVGKTRVPVVIGNDTPRNDGTYVQSSDPSVAFVAGKDLIETLDHDPGDYHTKEVHDGVVYASLTLGLAFHDAEGTRAMRKQPDGTWQLSAPLVGQASAPAITELIDAVRTLRAKHFVEQDAKDLARYGLSEPRFELTLTKKEKFDTGNADKKPDAPKKPEAAESQMTLRVGNACVDHPGESYLMFGAARTVNCAADTDLAKIQKPLPQLREGRILPFEDDEIAAVRVERGGDKLTITKNGNAFAYEVAHPGLGTDKGEARSDAVLDWFKALRAAQAERFDGAAIGAQPAAAALRVHVERTEGKPGYDLQVDARSSEVLVQRTGEPFSMVFAGSTTALLEPSSARFRKLEVLAVPEASLRAIELRRASTAAPERLERPDAQSRFAVVSPVHAPADSVELGELTRMLGNLSAVRFASDGVEAAQGLATPWLKLSVGSAGDKGSAQQRTIAIGDETEGGRFAQLDGVRGVFVIPTQFVAHVAGPLVSRTLLSAPLEQISAIEFVRGDDRVRVERRGDEFVATPEGKLSAAAARAAAEAVATLRASQVTGYGPAQPADGMKAPFASITVTARAEGQPEQRFTIELGAETADGSRHARRDDQQVGFVLPKRAIDALRAPFGA